MSQDLIPYKPGGVEGPRRERTVERYDPQYRVARYMPPDARVLPRQPERSVEPRYEDPVRLMGQWEHGNGYQPQPIPPQAFMLLLLVVVFFGAALIAILLSSVIQH